MQYVLFCTTSSRIVDISGSEGRVQKGSHGVSLAAQADIDTVKECQSQRSEGLLALAWVLCQSG
jgi:hypothetical protein